MKVSGSSLKLKCLELTEFKTVPSLVEASFGGSFVEFVRQSFMLQIKVLKLDITQNSPDVIYWLSQLPKLKNLKHLELVACVDDGITLGACVMLLKASPSLWRFTIKVNIFVSLALLISVKNTLNMASLF
ncbi:hypothetical protein QL285_011294 [Trifolium repens]|nr:hypothetical protein QL285_011294 [Trifolium repens]